MRILCLLNRDLASSFALNLLLPALAAHQVRIGLTEQVGRASDAAAPEHPARRALRVAEQVLPNEVFFPLIEQAGLADDGTRLLTFAEIQRHRAIPVAALPDPNQGAGLAAIQTFAPDLILTIRYGRILKSAALAVPPLGVLNLHSGLLPQYRGVLATFRALLAGDPEIGCTLHRIDDPTIDTGPIIATARRPVEPDRSLLWHVLSLYPLGVSLLSKALECLASGTAPASIEQPVTGGAYYSAPGGVEWELFEKRGWRAAEPSDLDLALRRYCPGDPQIKNL